MTRWTKAACLAGKHEETLLPTVRTPDTGKPAHRIAAVEILLHNILDHRTQEAVLPLKPALVFSEKLRKVMKKHPIEDGALRMSKTINPCHGRSHTSRNGPTSWIRPPLPEKAARALAQKNESGQENVNRCLRSSRKMETKGYNPKKKKGNNFSQHRIISLFNNNRCRD
jgi:hypothetical protein